MHRIVLRNTQIIAKPSCACTFFHAPAENCSSALLHFSEVSESSGDVLIHSKHEVVLNAETATMSDVDLILAKVRGRRRDDEVFQCLMHDQTCNSIELSHETVHKLLRQFKDDWKLGLGIFKWAGSHKGYRHSQEACDTMVDILGKAKKWDEMKLLLVEISKDGLVALSTIAKVMRRFTGAGQWEDAVRTFDELGNFGLKKNAQSMNLLIDTLCKEGRVEQARTVFLELKSHIPPDAHTFNIFINGWCKVNRVDEAHWTIEEMKGHGFRPCVISYSTIIQFHCKKREFKKVYDILDEMEAQGCPPSSVTYTTIMCSLTKSEEFEEALEIAGRMRASGCKPDTLFYNCLIHTLGCAGQLKEAVHEFSVEMPKISIPPNTSTYNSVIAMFCHHGQEQKAFKVLQEMEISKHCIPDGQTYYPLLKSCLKRGNVDKLRELLDDMVNKHHLSLDISAYSLLIHGLCRANRFEWAYQLFQQMIDQDLTPNYRTCRLLLDEAKQKHMHDAATSIEDVMKKS